MRKQHGLYHEMITTCYFDAAMKVGREDYRLRDYAYYGVQYPIQIHVNAIRGSLKHVYRWWSE